MTFDGAEWQDNMGRKYHFYHFVDVATNFQIAIPAHQFTTASFIQLFRSAWLRWAGNPRMVMFDSASEFNSEDFGQYLRDNNMKHYVIPAEAHWQLGRAERHGAVLKHMLDRYHSDQPIKDDTSFEEALQLLRNAKNSMSRHAGYTPELLVLGKRQQVPGSNVDPNDSASFEHLDSDELESSRFASLVARREAARRAFVTADHDASLRRAFHARSRPDRTIHAIGDAVMYWKAGKGAEEGQWQGPGRVLMIEPNCVWISHLTRLGHQQRT